MTAKSMEAVLVGVGLWIAGATAVVLLGGLAAFHLIAPPGALLLIPVMYALTRWHLRDVASVDRSSTGLRLGVLATGVQFPLDLLAFLSIYEWGFPDLSSAGQRGLVYALLIGYACLLFVPWWTARAAPRSR